MLSIFPFGLYTVWNCIVSNFYEYSCIILCVDTWFHLLWVDRLYVGWIHAYIFLWLPKKFPTVIVYESYYCCISLSPLSIVSIFTFNQSNIYVLTSHFGLKLHFPDNWKCWTSLHVIIGLWIFYFGSIYYVFCQNFNNIFTFLSLNC